jgi:hypothetical protein
MDVEEFFNLGAAFGLQIRTMTDTGGYWAEDSGDLLICKVSLIVLYLSNLPSRKGSCVVGLIV